MHLMITEQNYAHICSANFQPTSNFKWLSCVGIVLKYELYDVWLLVFATGQHGEQRKSIFQWVLQLGWTEKWLQEVLPSSPSRWDLWLALAMQEFAEGSLPPTKKSLSTCSCKFAGWFYEQRVLILEAAALRSASNWIPFQHQLPCWSWYEIMPTFT